MVDNDLANSLSKLQNYATGKGQAEKVSCRLLLRTQVLISAKQLFRKVALMDIVNVEDLALDFTLPGYDIELRVRDLVLLETAPADSPPMASPVVVTFP